MPEDPEDMLPEQRVAAAVGSKKVVPEEAVEAGGVRRR